jgi:alpha-1,2-mannosyltransferase
MRDRSLAVLVPSNRWSAGGAAALVAVGLLLLGLFGGLLGAFDLDTLLRAGTQVLHGANPYDPPTSPVFLAGHAFVYPAFVAWCFAPLAALPHAVAAGLYIAASAGAIVAVCSLLDRPGFTPAALVLTSSATIVGLQMGTVNAWMLLGLALAWSWRDRRPGWAGVVLGVAVSAKLFLVPMLAWPLIARRWGVAAAGAATFVALVAGSVLGGPISVGTYGQLLAELSAHEVSESWSLASLVQSLGVSPGVATAVAVAVAAVGLAAAWRAARRLGEARVVSIALLACLVVSPIVWSSYLLLLALPLLLATRGNVALLVASAASWLIVTPDVAPAGNVVAGLALLVVVAVHAEGARLPALWGRMRRWRPARWMAAVGAAAVLAAVLVLVPPAVRSPLPVLGCMGALGLLVTGRRPLALDLN